MTGNFRFTPFSRVLLASAAGLLAGCSLQPVPAEEMVQARAAIAQVVSRSEAPSEELKRAQRKMALAQRWTDAKDHGPARWLAEQAQVDAELALARIAGHDARQALAQRTQAPVALARTSYLMEKPR